MADQIFLPTKSISNNNNSTQTCKNTSSIVGVGRGKLHFGGRVGYSTISAYPQREMRTFRKEKKEFKQPVFPCCSSFAWNACLPLHKIQTPICRLCWLRVESLSKVSLESKFPPCIRGMGWDIHKDGLFA